MNSISASFNTCSAEIKRWLQREPAVTAEVLTHWLLPELARLNKKIHYKDFAFPENKRTTQAGWQWWFVLSDAVSFAPNARAIKLENDVVQNVTMEDDNPAFYVLYSTNDQNSSICKNGKSLDGIFLVEANKWRNAMTLNQMLSIPEKLAQSNPASCLLGCPGIYGEGMDMVQGFRQHITHYYPLIGDEDQGRTSGFRHTPADILAFMETGIYAETLHDDGKSNAILLFDLRPE